MKVSAARTIKLVDGAMVWPVAEPDAILDYSGDASVELADVGDVISAASIQISPWGAGELVANALTVDGALLTGILAGGVPGRTYKIKLIADTAGGLIFEWLIMLAIDDALATDPPPIAPHPGFSAPVTWAASAGDMGLENGSGNWQFEDGSTIGWGADAVVDIDLEDGSGTWQFEDSSVLDWG